LHKIKLHHFV